MFQCDYCGAQFKEHPATCPQCGALVQATQPAPPPPTQGAALRAVCIRFEGEARLRLDETIEPNRLQTVQEKFRIPADETVLMVYDNTLLGSNNIGFAIGQRGLYWKNDWTTETNRTFLKWADFADRSLQLEEFAIDLGRGDKIGVAAAGGDAQRQHLFKLLNEIKAHLTAAANG